MNIQPQVLSEITACVKMLRENGFIIFPGEKGWSIGCNAVNRENIFKLRDENLTEPEVLLDSPGRLNKFITGIPDTLWDLVEFSTRPLTLLLAPVVNLPAELMNEQNEVAFRIAKDDFTSQMLHRYSGPVFSALIPDGFKPASGGHCTILNTPAYVVNLRAGATPDAGVILRLSTSGRIEFIRK